MRIIVAGGRDFNNYDFFKKTMDEKMKEVEIVELVSGHAKGADSFAERYAADNGVDIKIFPAEWGKYGKAAGPIRNRKMMEYAKENDPMLIAFWDGKSKGTKNMISQCENSSIPCVVVGYQSK